MTLEQAARELPNVPDDVRLTVRVDDTLLEVTKVEATEDRVRFINAQGMIEWARAIVLEVD